MRGLCRGRLSTVRLTLLPHLPSPPSSPFHPPPNDPSTHGGPTAISSLFSGRETMSKSAPADRLLRSSSGAPSSPGRPRPSSRRPSSKEGRHRWSRQGRWIQERRMGEPCRKHVVGWMDGCGLGRSWLAARTRRFVPTVSVSSLSLLALSPLPVAPPVAEASLTPRSHFRVVDHHARRDKCGKRVASLGSFPSGSHVT